MQVQGAAPLTLLYFPELFVGFYFRNWYVDEPSCGGEVCVVLYHQPSAPPGVGGPYMFQWNDDRCTMKNNFICKYSLGEEPLGDLKPNHPAEGRSSAVGKAVGTLEIGNFRLSPQEKLRLGEGIQN